IEADLDFSLIRLDAGIQPQAQVAHWGGPTRINQEITYEPQLLKMFGSGLVVEDAVPQRQLVAPNGLDGEEDLYVTGVATPGDSGAPALTDSGEALGVVVSLSPTLRIPEQGPPYVGVVRIARLPFNLAIAEKLLGIDLKIERAPVL
ncbi:MAG TPA: hypothetical protein VNP73_03150, partial [Actinomycetota bacterium]|nr:hypothetical protein [Actinomycetota bacterium]